MIIYFILLALLMLLLSNGSNRMRPNTARINAVVVLLILFAGFRNQSVGTDTGNYVYFFVREAGNYFKSANLEAGFLALETLASAISMQYWSLLLLIAIVSVIPYVYSIRSLSINIPLSFFIYITLAAYIFFFNGARQGMAASLFSIALVFLMKRKLYWFIFWVVVASTFHRTIFIMLPFYYILRFEYSTLRMILFAVFSVIGLTFLTFFLSFLDEGQQDKYADYVDRGASGGFLLGFFFFIISIALIYFRRTVPKETHKTYDVYLNLCVFNSLIYVVVIAAGVDVNFLRFSQYFLIGYVMIWPIIFKYTPAAKDALFRYVFYTLHLGFYGVYLSKMSNMIPYVLNLELFF